MASSSSRYPRHRVRAHYRKDGTYVRGHYRARRGTGSASSSSSRSSATAAAGSGIGLLVFFVVVAVFLELAQRAG